MTPAPLPTASVRDRRLRAAELTLLTERAEANKDGRMADYMDADFALERVQRLQERERKRQGESA